MVDQTQWFVRKGDKTHGPFTSQQLKQLAHEAKIGPSTNIRRGTDGQWVTAQKVKGLFASKPATGNITAPHPPTHAVVESHPVTADPSAYRIIPPEPPLVSAPSSNTATGTNPGCPRCGQRVLRLDDENYRCGRCKIVLNVDQVIKPHSHPISAAPKKVWDSDIFDLELKNATDRAERAIKERERSIIPASLIRLVYFIDSFPVLPRYLTGRKVSNGWVDGELCYFCRRKRATNYIQVQTWHTSGVVRYVSETVQRCQSCELVHAIELLIRWSVFWYLLLCVLVPYFNKHMIGIDVNAVGLEKAFNTFLVWFFAWLVSLGGAWLAGSIFPLLTFRLPRIAVGG